MPSDFDAIRPVWFDGALVFYDVFRGKDGRVWALAPLTHAKFDDPTVRFPCLVRKPTPMLSTVWHRGILSDVFVDQGHHNYLYGSQNVHPRIHFLHWHAILFEFDVSPYVESVKLHYTIGGERRIVTFDLPEPPAQMYEFADTTMFRDDAEILGEWLDHSRSVGFEHFYLYDNFSETLPEFGPDVTLLDWPFPYYFQMTDDIVDDHLYARTGQGLGSQIPQQLHALYKHGSETEWLAFFDDDEYLVLPDGYDLSNHLVPHERRTVVTVGSVFFGTQRVDDFDAIPAGERIRRGYVMRETLNEESAFTRRKPLVHIPLVVPGEHVVIHDWQSHREPENNMTRHPFQTDTFAQLPLDQARLNHYYALSYRRRMEPGNYHNQVLDTSILPTGDPDAVAA